MESEIESLQQQRDQELRTLRYTAARTKRNLTRAVSPDRQIRKHLGIALAVAAVGGYLLAPAKGRKKKRRRAESSESGGSWMQSLLQQLRHYFPQLGSYAPFLAQAAKAAPQRDNVSPPSSPPPAEDAARGQAIADDYGRDPEPVKPFSAPNFDDVESTPIQEAPAAYRGYTSDTGFEGPEYPYQSQRAPRSGGDGPEASRESSNPLKALAATFLAELASRVDWQQLAQQLGAQLMHKVQRTVNPQEHPSVAVADAGTTKADEKFGGRFGGSYKFQS